jgi:hypothetical protein
MPTIDRVSKKIQVGLIQASDEQPREQEGRIWMIADEGPEIIRPHIVRPGMYQVHFEVRNGLSMAHVRASDVTAIEAMKKGCCGRPSKHIYRKATSEEITRWQATSQPQG